MNRKRILRGLLFPPAWVLCVLPPAAFVSLTAAAVRGMSDCAALYFLYGLSAYALMLWALAVPRFLRTVRRVRAWVRTTRWGGRYLTDIRFRGTVRMVQGTVVNLLYVAFRTAAGIRYGSRWFLSLAAYYFLLALTRAFLLLGLHRRAGRKDPLAYEYASLPQDGVVTPAYHPGNRRHGGADRVGKRRLCLPPNRPVRFRRLYVLCRGARGCRSCAAAPGRESCPVCRNVHRGSGSTDVTVRFTDRHDNGVFTG
ncbi:MAG: hypothetical protein L6V84_03880 [Oscillospiraceae bacterium]|nr:MAG: hypothetical protein L6V84_03880 [Oscillospiraceae bacterium]